MSLGSSLSLSPDVATGVDTNAETFAQRYSEQGKGEYAVAGLTLPEKRTLLVSHETTSAGVERHLARIDDTKVDAELVPATISVHIVITRPPSTALTEAVVIDVVNQLVDFLVDDDNANVGKLLNGEV